jgi:hypothetical protein
MLKVANSVINASQITGVLPVVNGGTGVTTSTGTGNTVLSASPTLSGNVSLSTGNLIPGTAAKGINFTANTLASGMTSQLFQDYQEGVWTPVLAFGGNSVGITFSASYNTSSVTKIGSRVFVSGISILTSKGSSVGDATLKSLPFPADGVKGFSAVICSLAGVTFTGQYSAELDANADTINFYQVSNLGVQSALTNTNFSNSSAIVFSFSYFTAA